MLSTVLLNSLKPQPKLKRYYDTGRSGIGGLYVEVTPTLKMTFRLKYKLEGKERTFKLGTFPEITIAEARLRCAEPKRLIADGIDPNDQKKLLAAAKVAERSAHTLSMVMEQYLLKEAPKLKSCRTIGIRLEKIKREHSYLCNKKIKHIDQADLIKFRDCRLELVKGATVKKELQHISSVFRYAKEEMLIIKHNPVADIKKPKDSPPRQRRVSDQEIDMLCAASGYRRGTTPKTSKQYAAWCFLFAIQTAMRAGEIIGMKWSNFKGDHVHLPDTKNGNKRNVPLSDSAVELIELMRGLNENKIVPITSGSLDTTFRKIRASCALEETDLHFHDSRHEATTRLAKVLDFHDLAKVTGHTDLRILLKVYYNITASELAVKIREGMRKQLKVLEAA